MTTTTTLWEIAQMKKDNFPLTRRRIPFMCFKRIGRAVNRPCLYRSSDETETATVIEMRRSCHLQSEENNGSRRPRRIMHLASESTVNALYLDLITRPNGDQKDQTLFDNPGNSISSCLLFRHHRRRRRRLSISTASVPYVSDSTLRSSTRTKCRTHHDDRLQEQDCQSNVIELRHIRSSSSTTTQTSTGFHHQSE